MKEIKAGTQNLDRLIKESKEETITQNIFDIANLQFGWMARHDPEELDRQRMRMSDEVNTDEISDWDN